MSFCILDDFFSFFKEKWLFGYSWSTLLWYRCYYPHQSRGALFPVCGILFFFFFSSTFCIFKNYIFAILHFHNCCPHLIFVFQKILKLQIKQIIYICFKFVFLQGFKALIILGSNGSTENLMNL